MARIIPDSIKVEHPMDKFSGKKINLFQPLTEEEQKMLAQIKKEKPSEEWHGAKVYYWCDVEMIVRRVMEIMKERQDKN